ncbi:MAG: parvulin peptidyl-prolyl isomerase, partial [Alphaproteobacteria bacterium]|nr:parvulin peptidyl-prolyl isomerase [Alphaproteobacteria bacterium]
MTSQIRASHILIMHADAKAGSSDRPRADALKEIDDLKRRIAAGEDFA